MSIKRELLAGLACLTILTTSNAFAGVGTAVKHAVNPKAPIADQVFTGERATIMAAAHGAIGDTKAIGKFSAVEFDFDPKHPEETSYLCAYEIDAGGTVLSTVPYRFLLRNMETVWYAVEIPDSIWRQTRDSDDHTTDLCMVKGVKLSRIDVAKLFNELDPDDADNNWYK